jgi:hypothetical protein
MTARFELLRRRKPERAMKEPEKLQVIVLSLNISESGNVIAQYYNFGQNAKMTVEPGYGQKCN